MRKGRVPSTHPLYRGLQVERKHLLFREETEGRGMRGGVREKEEGKGRERSRRGREGGGDK